MKIYNISSKGKNNFDYCVVLPNEIKQIGLIIENKNEYTLGSITEYLLSQDPNRYKNIELQVNDEKRYKGPFELERIDVYDSGGFWLVNERFKQFAQKENLTFSFYPTLLKGERRYIMMFDGLPQIYDLHKIDDVTVTSYPAKIFRSDILEYLGYVMFTSEVNITLYVTENMKEKLENEKFNVCFSEEKVLQLPYDKEKVEKEISEIDAEYERLKVEEWDLPRRTKKQTDIIDEYLKEHPHFTQEQYFEEVKEYN